MCTNSAPRRRGQWYAHALVNAWDGVCRPHRMPGMAGWALHISLSRGRVSFSPADFRHRTTPDDDSINGRPAISISHSGIDFAHQRTIEKLEAQVALDRLRAALPGVLSDT
jgi:hypothetical protein